MKSTGANKQGKPVKEAKKPPKRKSRKAKKIFENKVLAVIIAGTLVILTFAFSRLTVYFQSTPNPPENVPESIASAPPEQPESTVATIQPTTSPVSQSPVEPQSSRQQPTQQQPSDQRSGSQTPPPQSPALTINQSQPEQPVIVPQSVAQSLPPEMPGPEIASKGKLVFVIDDAGNNLRELDPFLSFPGPLTIAVLPGLPNSAEAARRIRAAGKEVFLHQPMESLGGSNPGPGAIFSGMEEAEIRAIVNRNLDELWPVKGMNNHEGSKITMDEKIMEIILQICRERGILFLDSRTTAETKAPAVSKNLGISIRERDVFLDNEQDRNSIMRYLSTGLERAGQKGNVIMIGHTWSPNLAPLLEEQYSHWLASGFSLTTVTGLGN